MPRSWKELRFEAVADGRLDAARVADVVRQTIESHLDDLEDEAAASDVLRNEADSVLDWADVRQDLIDQD